MGGVETGGDGSEMGSLTEKGKKIKDQYGCQPHPGQKEENVLF